MLQKQEKALRLLDSCSLCGHHFFSEVASAASESGARGSWDGLDMFLLSWVVRAGPFSSCYASQASPSAPALRSAAAPTATGSAATRGKLPNVPSCKYLKVLRSLKCRHSLVGFTMQNQQWSGYLVGIRDRRKFPERLRVFVRPARIVVALCNVARPQKCSPVGDARTFNRRLSGPFGSRSMRS